jgi:type IV secretion system protein VirB5
MKINQRAIVVALAGVLALGASLGAPPAQAQMAVIDPANLSEAIARYSVMMQQLSQLQSQLGQAQQQYAALTGSRGMGSLLPQDYRANIPTSWEQTLAMMPTGPAGAIADTVRTQASQLGQPYFDGVSPEVTNTLGNDMNVAVNGQALNSQAYDATADRFTQIEQLRDQINGTHDLKGIAELQARIGIETANLLNELIRVQTMNGMLLHQQQVQTQQERQQSYQLTASKY